MTYSPTETILSIAEETRQRYLTYDREMLTMLREALVDVALQPGQSPETYWLFQTNVKCINDILLEYGHDRTAASRDQPPPRQGS